MTLEKRKKWGWAARVLCLALLVAACAWAISYTGAASELPEKASGSGVIHRGEPNDSQLSEPEIIGTACALIEQGKFDEAGAVIEASRYEQQDGEAIAQLKGIVRQWDELQKERAAQLLAAYREQLAEFERLKEGKAAESNDVNLPRWDVLEDMQVFAEQWLEDVNFWVVASEADEPEKPQGPTAVLAAVVRTSEFADEQQKKSLLSDPCVLDAIAFAEREAVKLNSEGKWLDAYVKYYSWLTALDPNNKVYKDYAEQLIGKAGIAGSFQDSPCETSTQRFDGVKRRIFERAVDALNFNYVNKISYREMAVEGIRQCRMLAEVIGTLTGGRQKAEGRRQKTEGEPNVALLGDSFRDFVPDAEAMAKLIEGLASLEEETGDWPEGMGKDWFISVFEKVLELNLTMARLPEGVVIAQFAEASFGALDPYTVIVWPTGVSDFEKAMTNEFFGIGIEIARQKGQLTVASLVPDTPAYNSGLDAGDVIESIDGVSTKDMPLACAVKSITGQAGTKVTLTVRREGELRLRNITIIRAKIVVPTIRGWQRDDEGKWQYMVDESEKIGYVRLTSFSENTASDLEGALNSLESAGMRGLILDLRYNSGGYFDSAVDIANYFLEDGLIVITRPRFGIPTYAAARKDGTHPNYPMVVLVNSGSASASEIVAGALADPSHRRATLVGERTHGKGMVQGITHYPGEGAQLKYTMAYYHLPSGQRVKSRDEAEKEGTQDWGVGPDVKVELRSDELRRMFEIQRDNEVLFKAGHKAEAGPVKRHSLEQMIEADPQLTTAILVVRSKLVREQAKKN